MLNGPNLRVTAGFLKNPHNCKICHFYSRINQRYFLFFFTSPTPVKQVRQGPVPIFRGLNSSPGTDPTHVTGQFLNILITKAKKYFVLNQRTDPESALLLRKYSLVSEDPEQQSNSKCFMWVLGGKDEQVETL